ncbi:MAG: hypothetical protein ACI9K5_002747 [Gammaproteobacteria bacterium]|jgi:hypothetical protein
MPRWIGIPKGQFRGEGRVDTESCGYRVAHVTRYIPGNSYFDRMGIKCLGESSQSIESPWYGPACLVVWEGIRGDYFRPLSR